MGFGTLFIGYFFLINISYYEYTDIIAAMVMLMGLYKLSEFNRGFKTAFALSGVFALFSLAQITLTALEIFIERSAITSALAYMNVPRCVLLLGLTYAILLGISDVATEVEANELASRAKRSLPFSFLYAIIAVAELPVLSDLLGKSVAYIYFTLLVAEVIFIAINLVTVYRAYMQICMPEDLEVGVKKSRFDFVNRYRAYEEKKSGEYAEYKLERERKKLSAKNKKKSKRK